MKTSAVFLYFTPIVNKSLYFKKNAKTEPLIPKNDVTEPKAGKLGYSNYQLKNC